MVQYKLYIIGENVVFENNIKWICDMFKDEFISNLHNATTNISLSNTIEDADIIWILAPWVITKIFSFDITNKIIITTIHHIDLNKYDKFIEYFNYIDKITTYYHTICVKTDEELRKITEKKIIHANFWIDGTKFIKNNNVNFRQKYNIPADRFIIGSFQRDTEGKYKCVKPKLSKGPDILINILCDMKEHNKNPFVLLTGRRRNYIIAELQRYNIDFMYLEMVSTENLSELYQCLDLYIVSSRIEGGPRAIMECAILQIPIISTNVGIADLILPQESIYDANNFLSYRNAKPDVKYAYEKVVYYEIKNYLSVFIDKILYTNE